MKESQERIADQSDKAKRRLERIEDAVRDLDVLSAAEARTNVDFAVSTFAKIVPYMQEIGAEIAQLAIDHGITKKALGEAWDMPASTFTGIQKRSR